MADQRTILVVEDSPTMQAMYRAVLGTRDGLSLLFARDGAEGLDRAAVTPHIDLFIVDINMPGLGGLEFLRRLRGELGVTRTPAIVISTEADDADREAAFGAGATGYLPKPWRAHELVAAVDGATGAATDHARGAEAGS